MKLSAQARQEALAVAVQWLRLFRDYAPVVAPTADTSMRLLNWERLAKVLAAEELAGAIAVIEEVMEAGEVNA